MIGLSVVNANKPGAGVQNGDPLLHQLGSKLWIIAPSKAQGLAIYGIEVPSMALPR